MITFSHVVKDVVYNRDRDNFSVVAKDLKKDKVVGSEDGNIYTYDASKALSFKKIPAVPTESPSTAKSPVTGVALEGARKIYFYF